MVKRIAKKFVTLLVVMLMLLQSYTSTAIAIQTSTPSKIWSEDPIKTKNESVTNQTSQEGKSSNTVITIDGENLEYPTGGATSSNTETSTPKEEAKEETKEEPKEEPKQTKGETILPVSLVLDVKDEYKNPVDGLEFRLLGKDGSHIKSVKTKRGLLILNDLKKGDYTLESSVIQPGYEKRNIKYSIYIGADGKIEVKDLVANTTTNLATTRDSLVAKDYTISITGEKLSDKDYSVKISLNADKADSIKGLNLVSEVDKAFNLSDKSVKNADVSFDTGLLQINNIKLDSNNNWSGKFTFSLKDSELENGQDKKDLRYIFNNIYTIQADHKTSGIGPVIYKGHIVNNKKINIILKKILKKTEDKTASPSKETETKDKKTKIAEENLFRTLIPSNLKTDIRDSLGNPMFMSMMDIYEGVINRRGLEYRSSPRIFGPTLDVIEPGIRTAGTNREGTDSSLTIYKKDDKGRDLSGAVFKLEPTDGKNKTQILGEKGGISTFVFSNIQHGSYLLTEEKAPDGYKKTDKKWDVYVAPNGNVFISEKKDNIEPEVYEGRDVSGSLNGSLNLKVPEGGIEYGTSNNEIKLGLNLSISQVNPGDYFDLKLSKNIHYNMLQPDKFSIPTIISADDQVIAKPYLISSGLGKEKTVRYVFTEYVAANSNIGIKSDISLSTDVYGAPSNSTQTFTASIGDRKIEKTTSVTHKDAVNATVGQANLKTAFDYTNDTNGKYTQVIYVNPKGINLKKTRLNIIPYYDNNYPKENYVLANISPTSTDIKIYKYTGNKLPDAVIIDKDNLTDVTSDFNGKIGIRDNFATVEFGELSGSEKYVVVVESNMAFPTGERKGTYLVQSAKFFDNTYSNENNTATSTDGIITQTSGASGSGQSTGSNNVSIEVPNSPVSKGKFIINKTTQDSKTPLGGAEFTLTRTNQSPQTPIVKKSDEKTGKVIFEDLEPGEYTLKETNAPEGYKKSEETWTVKVTENGVTNIIPDNKESSNKRTEAPAEQPSFLGRVFSIFQPKENNGQLLKENTILTNPDPLEIDGYKLSQTIEKTDKSPKEFLVKASIEDTKNDLEMVIVFENTTTGTYFRYGSNEHYMEKIKLLAEKAQKSNPNSKFSVIGTYTKDAAKVYAKSLDKNGLDRELSLEDLNKDITNSRVGLPKAFEEAYTILKNSNARQRVLIHISGTSLYPSWDKNDGVIEGAKVWFERIRSNDKTGDYPGAGAELRQFLELNIAGGGYLNAKSDNYPWKPYFDEIVTVKDSNKGTDLRGQFPELNKSYYKYQDKLLNIASTYHRDYEKFIISPAEGFKLTHSGSSDNFTGENILPGNSTKKEFSYTVSLDPSKNIDKKEVNSKAEFKYSYKNEEKTISIPIPTISIPKVSIEFTKHWKNTEEKEKSTITVELKAKTEKGAEINLADLNVNTTTTTASQSSGWKGRFENLPQFTKDGERIRYYVEEKSIAGQNSDFDVKYYYTDGSSNVIIENTKVPSITVPNQPEIKKGKFYVHKTDEKGNFISGAVFKLMRTDDLSSKIIDGVEDENERGKILFGNLDPGTYKLFEYKAPNGYDKTNETWIVNVDNQGNVTINNPNSGNGHPGTGTPTPDNPTTDGKTYTADTSAINKEVESNHYPGLISKVTNVDTKAKTFTMEVTVNTKMMQVKNSSLTLSGANLASITSVTSQNQIANKSSGNPFVINLNDSEFSNDRKVITISAKYKEQKDLEIKVDYNGMSVIGSTQYSVSDTVTSKVPIRESTSPTPATLNPTVFGTFENSSAVPTIASNPPSKIGVRDDGIPYVKVVNKKSEADIEFVKIDGSTKDKIGSTNSEKPTYLEAEFTLYKRDDQSSQTDKYEVYKRKVNKPDTKTEDYIVQSNKTDGKFKFEKLPDGNYAVKETKAPDGYIRPEDYISYFTIESGNVKEVSYKKPGTTESSIFGEIIEKNIDSATTKINYIYNYKQELPAAGGIGPIPTTLAGLLIMASTYLLYKKRMYEYLED
ncbi:SpaA isopeptide-forming pilin-related protein [Peptostreptococcus anaerobius]|uniref:SpaA isopeptide-forming pilin-related protein n=2 Tax=Bacteria TaxID=2 RepID=UPI0034A41256